MSLSQPKLDNIHVTAALYKLQRTFKLSRQLQYVKIPKYLFSFPKSAGLGYHLKGKDTDLFTKIKILTS